MTRNVLFALSIYSIALTRTSISTPVVRSLECCAHAASLSRVNAAGYHAPSLRGIWKCAFVSHASVQRERAQCAGTFEREEVLEGFVVECRVARLQRCQLVTIAIQMRCESPRTTAMLRLQCSSRARKRVVSSRRRRNGWCMTRLQNPGFLCPLKSRLHDSARQTPSFLHSATTNCSSTTRLVPLR